MLSKILKPANTTRLLFFAFVIAPLMGFWVMQKVKSQNGTASLNPTDSKVKQRQMPLIVNETSSLQVVKAEITSEGFSQFWGCAQSGLTLAEIDQKLNEMRNEWERDF